MHNYLIKLYDTTVCLCNLYSYMFWHFVSSAETCRIIPWLLKGLPDDGTCDVSKHVADLLTTGERILLVMQIMELLSNRYSKSCGFTGRFSFITYALVFQAVTYFRNPAD